MKKYSCLILGLCWLIFVPITGYAETIPAKNKIILIGADGLTEKVVAQLLSQNKLKNIKYMRENGAYGRIISINPTASPILWTSMATGKKQKDHGILGFQIEDPQTGRMIVANNSHRKTKAIWNILSENKLKVGLIGYFNTWPVEKVNGFMISDISISPVEKGCYPPETYHIMKEILAPYTTYDLTRMYPFNVFDLDEEEVFRHFTPKMFNYLDQLGSELINNFLQIKESRIYSTNEAMQYFEFLKHTPIIKIALRRYFLDHIRFEYAKKMYKKDIDLFILYLKVPDAFSHIAWEYYRPNATTSKPDIEAYKDIIPRGYVFIDQVLGYFLQAADSATTVIFVSDHGFGDLTKPLYNVNKMLNTMGYLDYESDSEIKRDKIFDDTIYRWSRHSWFRRLYVNLNNLYPDRDPAQDELNMQLIADQLAAIKVGDVKLFWKINYYPGKHLAAPIMKNFALYKDISTTSGIYAIEALINGTFYSPEFLNNLRADETITINGKHYTLKEYVEFASLGEHDPYDGLAHFLGPVIKSKGFVEGYCILDLTPTILKILDLPIGADMAGNVPIGIFKPEFLVQHQTQYIKSYDEINEPFPKVDPQASPMEDQLKQQLRSLGYIQ
jgi:predicted AlkP superfamily phosphohydrolase/phosphomutase